MAFYDFPTMYEFAISSLDPVVAPDEFYWRIAQHSLADAEMAKQRGERLSPYVTAFDQAEAERGWHKLEKPRFDVATEIVPFLTQTRLNYPSSFFRLPFPVFLIRFPIGHNYPQLTIDAQHEARTILVSEYDVAGRIPLEAVVDQYDRRITFWIDFGEKEHDFNEELGNYPVLSYQNVNFIGQETIETALQRMQMPERIEPGSEKGIPVPVEFVTACSRVVVSVCFLSTTAALFYQ